LLISNSMYSTPFRERNSFAWRQWCQVGRL
jgi:hypothetical protein